MFSMSPETTDLPTSGSTTKMPNLLDRRRLKDRIVENVSKAVKQIQQYQLCCGEGTVLVNEDRHFHKLVENLDHALLHGLRHITNGYWVVVREFTHSAVVRQVNLLTQVTTNLGRGRAWLYMALSDHLLESYLRCYKSERAMVRKFYVKEALVADQQQMELLLMLAAGLEHVNFQLELDVPYLDLASHIRVLPSRIPEEDHGGGKREEDMADALSLCSMDSSQSMNSSTTHDVETSSVASFGSFSGHQQVSPLFPDSIFLLDRQEAPDVRAKRPVRNCQSLPIIDIRHIQALRHEGNHTNARKSLDESIDLDCTDLEVIRVKVKGQRSRKKKLYRKRQKNDEVTVNDPDPMTPESGYRSAADRLSLRELDAEDSSAHGSGCETENSAQHRDRSQDISAGQKNDVSDDSAILDPPENSPDPLSPCPAKDCRPESTVQDPYCFTQALDRSIDWVEGKKKSKVEGELPNGLVAPMEDSGIWKEGSITDDANREEIVDDALAQQCASHESSIYDSSPERELRGVADGAETVHLARTPSAGTAEPVVKLKCTAGKETNLRNHLDALSVEDRSDVCEPSSSDGAGVKGRCLKSKEAILSELSQTDVQEKKDVGLELTGQASSEESPQWLVSVDNNMKLLLMLQVFEEEEEKFCTMFTTSLGHTEGELEPVLTLVTTRGLYLLTRCGRNSATRFQKHTTVKYTELDYISLSINYQVINIVCTNRRKQVWLTTGEEKLTRKLVQTIDTAIRDSVVELPRLCVLTDATTQKIGMRKWAATECGLQPGDIRVLCYTLVHWEDPQTVRSGALTVHATKQGTLMYKAYTSYFMGSVWKPAHFVLKSGVLYQYETEDVNSPPTACIPLNFEECSGCRRVAHGERSHCVEILLSDGSSLQLASPSEVESMEWLQCLCQAVAQGMQETAGASGCLPCCLVLTPSLLLACHEDLLSNFFRKLGSVNVVDVTRVLIDPGSPCYCLLALEAKSGRQETDYWVLYFNAAAERDRLITALDFAWRQHFQVSLPTNYIYDMALQQRCRDGVLKIQQQRQV